MAYEPGGRADKYGNRFEYNWTINKLLDVLNEKISYVIIEAVGDDEKGVDLWVGYKNGFREGQQCKGRAGSEEYWTYSSVNAKGIFTNWKEQLERNNSHWVSLVSPLPFTLFEDLLQRARDTEITKSIDFYNYQIKKSGSKTITLFHQYCGVMGLDYNEEEELSKAINYLSRTYCRQEGDYEQKEILLAKINLLFVGNEESIYSKFLELILTENIYGKQIDTLMLIEFCKSRNILFRNIANDDRLLPAIINLNNEYKKAFRSLSTGFIMRNEATVCMQSILNGDSVIIYGQAGVGKSGCIENIIQLCEELGILYLAIKLDKRIPKNTSEIWGKSMGLPASVSHCLNGMAPDKKAVLILDQLDALRWTQVHSGEALAICASIIQEIELINVERTNKISIVMVCRSYDLENDRSIKNLFENPHERKYKIEWKKIYIGKLMYDSVKNIVGMGYDLFSVKMRDLLATASNLYIWEQLDDEQKKIEIATTPQLVQRWWKQLKSKADRSGLSSDKLEQIKEDYVRFCDKNGRINVPELRLKMPQDYCDFLQSHGFILVTGNTVSLVHQSVLDCFFAEYMLDSFYEGNKIANIVGTKEKQTPGRRYQIQMFLQQLLEESIVDFLKVGEEMLELQDIRYSFKYVFLEILSQIVEPDDDVFEVLQKYLEIAEWENHFYYIIVRGKKAYASKLRECGQLDKWMRIEEKQNRVIDLFFSISPEYLEDDIDFIERYALDKGNGKKWYRCFGRDINEGNDNFFDLRIKFYEIFPEYLDRHIDIISMMKKCEIRTIKILVLMLKYKAKQNEKNLYCYEEEYVLESADFLVKDYRKILDILIPIIPLDEQNAYSEWSSKYLYRNTLERACIQIIKKANRQFAQQEPHTLLSLLSKYMGTGNALHNEIVLDALKYFPDTYADYIITYLCKFFEKAIFEYTSGNGNELLLAKMVIEKYSVLCADKEYLKLEYKIIHYIPSNATERLKYRMERNKNKKQNGYVVYWRFWGDLQREFLNVLPSCRMSQEAYELKQVLNRAFNGYLIYQYDTSCCAKNVVSPVSGKNLNYHIWKSIISNRKIPIEDHKSWKELDGAYIESSLSSFSSGFQHAVSSEPMEFLIGMLDCREEVQAVFVDAFISGLAYSEKLNMISNCDVEKVFRKFGYNYEDERALKYCRIIEKKEDIVWSKNTLEMLIDIAEHHKDLRIGEIKINTDDNENACTVEWIETNSINSVRGVAINAIGHILWSCKNLLSIFKQTIENMSKEENPIIKFSSLYALWPSYNIDRDWAKKEIVKVFLSDYRMLGFRDRSMLFLLHDEYGEQLRDILCMGFYSDDKRLQQLHGYTIAEMYLRYEEYSEVIDDFCNLNQTQRSAIIHMFTVYFGIEKYKAKAKAVMTKFLRHINPAKIENTWSNIFNKDRIMLLEDKAFLRQLMTSGVGQELLHVFVGYIEKNGGLLDFSDIIIDMSYNIINESNNSEENIWEIERYIPKLILELYDESSRAKTKCEKKISLQCLDIWDLMFEKQIGNTRILSEKMMEL